MLFFLCFWFGSWTMKQTFVALACGCGHGLRLSLLVSVLYPKTIYIYIYIHNHDCSCSVLSTSRCPQLFPLGNNACCVLRALVCLHPFRLRLGCRGLPLGCLSNIKSAIVPPHSAVIGTLSPASRNALQAHSVRYVAWPRCPTVFREACVGHCFPNGFP